MWRVETCATYDKSALLWEVCGESGYASTQLVFSIEDGKCEPIRMSGLREICSADLTIVPNTNKVNNDVSNHVTYPFKILSGSISLNNNNINNIDNVLPEDPSSPVEVGLALRESLRTEILGSKLVSTLDLNDITTEIVHKNRISTIYKIRIQCFLNSADITEEKWLKLLKRHLLDSISTGFFGQEF